MKLILLLVALLAAALIAGLVLSAIMVLFAVKILIVIAIAAGTLQYWILTHFFSMQDDTALCLTIFLLVVELAAFGVADGSHGRRRKKTPERQRNGI